MKSGDSIHANPAGCVRHRLVFVAGLVFALPVIARAGLVHERSWRIASHDGRYLLVMVSPHPVDQDASRDTEEAEVREIRKTYKQSGLYRNDGLSEPLWLIKYHIPVYEVYIAPGGEYVVIAIEGRHTISNVLPGGVVEFYHNGDELASYQDYQLPWCFVFKGLVNNLFKRNFIEFDEAKFDPHALTYSIKSNQAEEFVFDVKTGKIIHIRSLWPFYLGVPLLLVPLIVFGLSRTRSHQVTSHREERRAQFSVREMLLLVTAICAFLGLWLVSDHGILAIACVVIAIAGGAIAWTCSRSRRAWLIGPIFRCTEDSSDSYCGRRWPTSF